MPLKLAEFLVKFATADGELVVDGMAGSLTAAVAAENSGRRWVAVDVIGEYLKGALSRLSGRVDLRVKPDFDWTFCEGGTL